MQPSEPQLWQLWQLWEAVPGRNGRWARRSRQPESGPIPEPEPVEAPALSGATVRGSCAVCSEADQPAAPLSCCGRRVCFGCARRWAAMQVLELGASELHCTVCARTLGDSELPALLSAKALIQVRSRAVEQASLGSEAAAAPPSAEALGLSAQQLARIGVKRCPACGTGMQRDVETCHKMICRTCRAKFCFRCLARLEYFNCGCSGSEHRFVDPVDGRIIAHQ
mmetsp:Transcript_63014/g.204318  ORF Transcript_63014/g.204318 Transcript_63014/m.204318 type:complete len:224 (-) Transcript_63014:11-682(-)